MKRYLFDTNIFWRTYIEPQRLSKDITRIVTDRNNQLVISVITPWEMSIKISKNSLSLKIPLQQLIKQATKIDGCEILPVSLSHVLAADSLPLHHIDPFDRMLVAQAMVENIPILTIDTAIEQYKGIKVIS